MNKKAKIELSFNIISKYRTILMGLAILSIIFFHYTEDCVNMKYNLKPLIVNYKMYIGSCGVDIFLFLSGLGLYYSFKKNPNIQSFFQKRFSRILVPYFLVATPAWFLKDIIILNLSISQFIKDLLFISFFENGYVWFWYILMIMICYLIYPYIFHYIDGSNSINKMINIFLFFTVIGMMLELYNPEFFNNINIALLRFPAFFLGSFIGKASYTNYPIPIEASLLAILAFALLPLKSTSKTLLSRYILGFFGIVLFICIAIALEILSQKGIKLPFLKVIIEWCGNYSLEIYLTHVALRGIMALINFPTYRIRYECLLIFLTVLSSFLIKKSSNFIIKK